MRSCFFLMETKHSGWPRMLFIPPSLYYYY
jgi:hypothetical protein